MSISTSRLYAFLLLFTGLLWGESAFSQVTADFTAPVSSGCSPLIVNFQNTSVGVGLSYQWNLGNGNNSTTQNPSASYINPGTYTVTLTVTGPGGTDTEVKTAYITVFTPPNPDISAAQTTGCFPFPVNFTDNSTLGDSPIATWSWDFGDGGTSTAQNPTYTYTTSGTFGVTLLLIDANGCASNQTFPSFINSNNNRPIVAFDGNPQVACLPPVNVSFTNTSSGGTGALTYSWNFGDGGTSTNATPSHNYTVDGEFDVSLTATDQLGCATTVLTPDFITVVEDVNIDFTTTNTNGCIGTPVDFTDLSSPQPTTWLWDFGDGTTSTDQNPSHLYTTPGNYTVSLFAFYAGSCQGTELKTNYITIGGVPFVDFVPDQTAGCVTPFPVNFDNNSVGAGLTYFWDFGDGSTSTQTNPLHTYTSNGVFTANLTATNPQGCSITNSTDINITATTADFLPDVFGFCVPLVVNFSDLSLSATTIVSYAWDFGDGSTSTLANPTHTYVNTGTYDVSLTISNNLGCSNTEIRTGYIIVSTPPVANFVQTPAVICAGEFDFVNLSTGATDWYWDFGDLTSDVVQNPSHSYQDTGFFSVTLVALNNGCPDTVVANNMIYVSPPVANSMISADCQDPNSFTFLNLTVGDDSFLWTFGDGATNSTDTLVTHTYASPGTYYADLLVTNNTTGCTNQQKDTIYVTQLSANLIPSVTTGCAPLSVSFTDNSIDAMSWQWNFGGGAPGSNSQNPTRTFNNVGTYTVRLVVTDINGCLDTIIMPNLITTTGVNPSFDIDTAYGCDALTVEFSDLSTPSGTIVSWLWDFGDGSTSANPNPNHIYTIQGNYDVTLTATSNQGCVRSVTLDSIVQFNEKPSPDFSVDETLGCTGEVFQFTNLSSSDAVSYLWDFGDGTTSTNANPSHSYSALGTYTVSLTATNSSGCDSTLTQLGLFDIANPTANFTAFPTFAFCPPLLVAFTDASTDAVSWLWDFGNGSTSAIQNPSHIYTQSGIYTVRLIVTNLNGCTDTIVMPDLIQLSGPSGDFTFFPDTIGCPPYEITYVSNTTNATIYTWDFGDGSLGNGASATHSYTQLGAYIPTLIIEDNNGCSFTYQSVDTLQIAPLNVDAGQDFTICENESVQLVATGGDTYSWFPPVGLSDPNAANPFVSPTVTTTYIVTVQLLACQNTDTVVVVVNPAPQANFTVADVCFGDTTAFLSNSTMLAPDSIVSWNWNLDEVLSTDTNPSFLYTNSGTYDISLVVESGSGCTDTALAVVVVNPVPTANFTANDTCLFQPTSFTDLSTVNGTITTWQWTLGNGATSVQQNPSLVYSLDSVYTVGLVVTAAGGCTDTITSTVTVFPLPDAAYSVTDVCLGEEVVFADSSSISSGNIVAWEWAFGDGATNNNQNTTYLYSTAQTYVFSLTVTSSNGCSTSAAGPVNVQPIPISNYTMSATQSCFVPAAVSFTDQSIGAVAWQWSFGNGDSATTANTTTAYDTIGQFTSQLIVTSLYGCIDTSTQLFEVFPTVDANFTWSNPTGCQPWTVNFTNNSANSSNYTWDFQDADGSSNRDPIHIFEDGGIYSVTLIAEGLGGCADTLLASNIITVWNNPVADFEYEPVTEPISDGTVAFFNTSTPSYVGNWWDFGDGATSVNSPATHQYDFYGNKFVTLAIVDVNGCVDTISRYIPVEFVGTLFVPNALIVGDPDQQVSVFLPKGRGLSTYRCMIFDEWGNKIWESSLLVNGQPGEGWDGRYAGEPVPQGSYVWKIDGVFGDGEVWAGQENDGGVHQTGTVTVIR